MLGDQTSRMQDAFTEHVGQLTGIKCPSCDTELLEAEDDRRICPDCNYSE